MADEMHEQIDRLSGEGVAQVIGWRRHLHRNPELPNREAGTARLVAEELRAFGLDEVRTRIAGHGVVGVLRGGLPGPRVAALRADMDALPVPDRCGADFAAPDGGASHACGHDCHTAMLLGAARVLAAVRERLPGAVLFVFQPAEEGPPVGEEGGARLMVAEGAFADPVPTMAFGMHVTPHPKGWVGWKAGAMYGASCLVRIVLTGRQSHASSPWHGIDPMPAAGALLTGIGQLYRQMSAYSPLTVSIGHVEDVGRYNVIGETVTLWGTVRCAEERDMPEVKRRLTVLAEHTAQAYGCTARVELLQDVPAVRNEPAWVAAALPTLTRVAGADRVVEVGGTLGYDDVSELVSRFGGLYVMLGVQDTALDPATGEPVAVPGGRGMVGNHHPAFYADEDTLLTGVRLHAHAAYDHLVGSLLTP
ncbi:M20 metallopeptidase family protein [Streptomyces xanthophaeus]|uniref:M20 metallopeptidase family protein n=1 Tax=Streptomyces xanthophaeus TaxID=67385 RepID=UPI002648723F|nr:amidohydrolase [Streptomyces xanthophaeus]WKD34527.1 amidohydrolase [Streptomyces xanthophaeus]